MLNIGHCPIFYIHYKLYRLIFFSILVILYSIITLLNILYRENYLYTGVRIHSKIQNRFSINFIWLLTERGFYLVAVFLIYLKGKFFNKVKISKLLKIYRNI